MNTNDGICVCSKCRSSVAVEDAREVRDFVICTDCIAKLIDKDSMAHPVKVETRCINKFLLFMFSAVPGANYMYLGMMRKGLLIMSLFFGFPIIIGIMGYWAMVYVPILYFYSFFDSFAIRRKMYENAEFYHIR